MVVEIVCLFLPVAAFSGWLVGRRSGRQLDSPRQSKFSQDYFRGVSFLINDQADKAVDIFIEMLKVDSDTVETHLSLGSLFRRRGEVDRAIRIHQNLIARPNLSKEERALSLFELGQDYMNAGVYDRAEHVFLELVQMDAFRRQSLLQLIDIYQLQRDWEQAITIARRLASTCNLNMDEVIAHYYCELAEQARAAGQVDKQRRYLKQALAFAPRGVRPNLLRAQLDDSLGAPLQAIKTFKRLAANFPEYMPEILLLMAKCYNKIDKDSDFNDYLLKVLNLHPELFTVNTLADHLWQWKDDKRAVDLVTERLREMPSIQGIKTFIDLHLDFSQGAAREHLTLIKDLLAQLLIKDARYHCHHCGLSGNKLHWQCPGCKQWDSVKPVGLAAV